MIFVFDRQENHGFWMEILRPVNAFMQDFVLFFKNIWQGLPLFTWDSLCHSSLNPFNFKTANLTSSDICTTAVSFQDLQKTNHFNLHNTL